MLPNAVMTTTCSSGSSSLAARKTPKPSPFGSLRSVRTTAGRDCWRWWSASGSSRASSTRCPCASSAWRSIPRSESLSSTRRTGKDRLSDPASRHSGFAGLSLDVGDLLLVRLDLRLHPVELGESLLALSGDDVALCRVVDVHEIGRQHVDPALKRLGKDLRARKGVALVGDPLLPLGLGLRRRTRRRRVRGF